MRLIPKRPTRAERDAMSDEVFLDWCRMWIHCGRLGANDSARARDLLARELNIKIGWEASHVVWMLDHPGRTIPFGHVIIHLDEDRENYRPTNLLLLPKYQAASMTVREWWRKNAQRKSMFNSRD